MTLVIDSHFLCHRAFHTTGKLSHIGQETGVLFGFFRDVRELYDLFTPEAMVFCFDANSTKRKALLPEYKLKRFKKKQTSDEKEAYASMRRQIAKLRYELLPKIGFKNILWQKGYEADDLIATTCQAIANHCIVVSNDTDLHQLLSKWVSIWNVQTKKILTRQQFVDQWQLPPRQWPEVKAIAGCHSDEIPGVVGVGEKTAAAYLRGQTTPAKVEAIERFEHLERNRLLVTLPFAGTLVPSLQPDDVQWNKWDAVMSELGITTLRGLSSGKTKKNKRQGKRFKF